MRYSIIFSLIVENIPEDQFIELTSEIVKFLIQLEIDLKDVHMNKNCGFFKIEDCNVLFGDDFEDFALKNFKKIIWQKSYLPFEFGSMFIDGIIIQNFGKDDFERFKIIDVTS